MTDSKQSSAIALKKAQTSINNILKMIDEDKYCIEISQQILAVNGLLKSASSKILEDHLNSCFIEGMCSSDIKTKKALVQEVLDVIKLGGKN